MDGRCHISDPEAAYVEPTQALQDLLTAIKTHHSNNVKIYYESHVDNIMHKNGKVQGISLKSGIMRFYYLIFCF